MQIALDATYSIGAQLTGVGVYSNEIISGLSAAHPEANFRLCYRPHRYLRALAARCPSNCRRGILWEGFPPRSARLFHGLNQRLPAGRPPRSVCTFHDLFVITGDYSSEEFRHRFTAQARDAAARADLIIAVSEFTASQVCDLLSVDRSRVRVVHHGVHLPASPADGERGPWILHVGAIQRRKNVPRLLEAFENCPPGWRLVLAGSAGYGGSEIARRIEESPRRGEIDVTGYVAGGQLRRLYARASILAFPSLAEGFGLPLLEAMARGVAVLTSDGSALREVAGDAVIRINPREVVELGAAVRRLLEQPALQQQLRERGRARAREFGWRRAAEATLGVYRAVRDAA